MKICLATVWAVDQRVVNIYATKVVMEAQMSHRWSAAQKWGWNKRDRIREGETVHCGAVERQQGGS